MKIRGVLLGTIEEQIEGGDRSPIDPRLVVVDPGRQIPVTIGFQRDHLVGNASRIWHEDGRMMFEAEINIENHFIPSIDRAAIGINTAELAYDLEMKNALGTTVKGGKIFEIGLTDQNENRNQPRWEVIDGTA